MSDPQDREVDVVVVGLGPGGEYAAQKLSEAGLEVVGVSAGLVGGECPFYGCIPSKIVIRAADALAEARRADHLAGEVSVRPDWSRVAKRIAEDATDHWHDDSHADRLDGAGVSVVRGHARLAGPGRVEVDGTTYTARRGVVLNTGTRPAELPIDGLADTPYLTNRTLFELTELPASMVVVGGGPIGAEMAQAFSRFGTRVTVVDVADRLLGPEEPETSELLAEVFEREGIELLLGADIRRVDHSDRPGDQGGFRLQVGVGGEEREVAAEQLLVAAGRRTNLGDLGLETVGLDPEARSIETDDRMRAGEKLWAVGDITAKGQYTHVSMYQGAVAVADLLGEDGPRADYRAVSRVTFTDPEVGSVGLSERQAREQGIDVVTSRADVPESSRGWLHADGNDGLIKLVADRARGVLVGGSTVGPSGGEMLGLVAAAVHAEIPVAVLRRMHFAYPTFHRGLQVALDALAEDD